MDNQIYDQIGSPSQQARSPSLHSGDMADLLFDAVERAQLSDLFDELGPEAPTLLEPWTTRDLAAHLVLRERNYPRWPRILPRFIRAAHDAKGPRRAESGALPRSRLSLTEFIGSGPGVRN